MANTAQKNQSSTQRFTEIQDILDDVVIFTNGNACLVIDVRAVNFALLSREEQNTKIFSYASLLNSLSFPIEILIRNKLVDISSYITLLQTEMQRAKTPELASYIARYKNFVQELVKVNSVLDKKFYIVIPYSFLEKGVGSVATGAGKKGMAVDSAFAQQARQTLHTKAESIHSQLARVNLQAKTLGKEDLIKLYYDIYNGIDTIGAQNQISDTMAGPIVKGQQ